MNYQGLLSPEDLPKAECELCNCRVYYREVLKSSTVTQNPNSTTRESQMKGQQGQNIASLSASFLILASGNSS